MKNYESPELEVMCFDSEDIVTISPIQKSSNEMDIYNTKDISSTGG